MKYKYGAFHYAISPNQWRSLLVTSVHPYTHYFLHFTTQKGEHLLTVFRISQQIWFHELYIFQQTCWLPLTSRAFLHFSKNDTYKKCPRATQLFKAFRVNLVNAWRSFFFRLILIFVIIALIKQKCIFFLSFLMTNTSKVMVVQTLKICTVL